MAYTENLITIQQQVSNHLLLFHLLSCKYQCIELYLREFGIRKGLKKLVISSKIRIFIGENQ